MRCTNRAALDPRVSLNLEGDSATSMKLSKYLSTVESVHGEGRARGLFFQNCDDAPLDGRTVNIDGTCLLSFASCSYLGLEHHPAIKQGVCEAVERYGTQFSASRGYISAAPYRELEELLSKLFGGYALVTPTTTLGHQAAFGVLATEQDAIVIDHQAHQSIHQAARIASTAGTQIETVQHGEMERACEVVERLAATHRTVWVAVDGVYSMFGDLAPMNLLHRLLDIAPNVRLYVDDAHGMSWTGEHGRGFFLREMPISDRVVLATSFVKAFAAGGGCLVFSSLEERERVRMCGGTLLFSGPLQPPMLGATLASTRIHLSNEITELQQRYSERISQANRFIKDAELPLLIENESPIFFVRLARPRAAFNVAERLRRDGIYVCVSAYPVVPVRRAGIRLAITVNHTEADLKLLTERLAVHVSAVMKEEGITRAQLDDLFDGALPADRPLVHRAAA